MNREQHPEALRAFPLLSHRCALWDGGRRPRCGPALAWRRSLGGCASCTGPFPKQRPVRSKTQRS
ncbi:MAG: hypothetical protein EON49_21095 [Acidovorax sp.]|nr:MAG: hypothetical protein EON49_21095 [Acidovorax sp.]